MRIVQLIDSLNIGGAEKMAVNFANALNKKIDFSGIISSRKKGFLLDSIENKSDFLFLNKKKSIDFKAILELKKYCKINKINFIHAHTTSFFTAFLLKLFYFKISIIYHEHTGSRSSESIFQNKLLWFCSFFFKGIIVVNQDLEIWCKYKLNCKNIIYLPNFVSKNSIENSQTILFGNHGKRILYLANLKNPKNHKLLIEAAVQVIKKHSDWSFHLVGTDFHDNYSNDIKSLILKENLQNNVFIYGLKIDIINILSQSEICVIASNSEGLPVSFLEYGINKKPVLSTNVGEISKIIINNKNGILVPTNDPYLFSNELLKLIENKEFRLNLAQQLYNLISNDFSEQSVINQYKSWILKITNAK